MADAAITEQMAVPRAILPESGFQVTNLEKGGVTWASRKGGAPSILVGFASTVPTEKVRLKQIILFRVTEKGAKIFNNVEPAEDDPVKWTRVSRCRVREWDDVILSKAGGTEEGEDHEACIVDWLSLHFEMHKDSASIQLGKQHEEKELKKGLEDGKRPKQPFSWKPKTKTKKTKRVLTGTVKIKKSTKANKSPTNSTLKIPAKAFSRAGTGASNIIGSSGGKKTVVSPECSSSLFGGSDSVRTGSGHSTSDFIPDC